MDRGYILATQAAETCLHVEPEDLEVKLVRQVVGSLLRLVLHTWFLFCFYILTVSVEDLEENTYTYELNP